MRHPMKRPRVSRPASPSRRLLMGSLLTLLMGGSLLFAVSFWRKEKAGGETVLAAALPDPPTPREQELTADADAHPENPAATLVLADLQLESGRPFTALWEYGRALILDETHPPAALGE